MAGRTLYTGKLLTLIRRTAVLPTGVRVDLEQIIHPGAALIVPFLSQDRILFIRQLRPVINRYLYELPAGTLDPHEKPRACALRELIEETGYAARRLARIGRIFPVPGYSTEMITIFRADGLRPRQRTPEADEVISVRVLTRARVRRLFAQGKIIDAKTICALAFCGVLS